MHDTSVILEWSEEQQAFHFNYSYYPNLTNGYVPIANRISRAEAIEFCKTIKSDRRYTTEELKEYLKFSERVVKEV
jgi:hypothetical protein